MGRLIDTSDLVKSLFDYESGKKTLGQCIDDTPTAQQWIPCSERLPEAENMYKRPKHRYLCQSKCANELFVGARLTDDIGRMKDWWDWYGTKIRDEDFIAWMPLPEPWEGEQK